MAENTPATVSDRYGRARNRRRDLIVGVTAAVALVAGGVVFLATGGMPTAETSIEYRDIAHTIDDNDTLVTLTFEVTGPADRELVCEIQALNPSYAVVGMKYVEVPVSESRSRVFTEEVRTHNRATTVTVDNCWVQPE